jgi:hypothetical protein
MSPRYTVVVVVVVQLLGRSGRRHFAALSHSVRSSSSSRTAVVVGRFFLSKSLDARQTSFICPTRAPLHRESASSPRGKRLPARSSLGPRTPANRANEHDNQVRWFPSIKYCSESYCCCSVCGAVLVFLFLVVVVAVVSGGGCCCFRAKNEG